MLKHVSKYFSLLRSIIQSFEMFEPLKSYLSLTVSYHDIEFLNKWYLQILVALYQKSMRNP